MKKLLLLLVLGLGAFNIFYNAGGQPVGEWDEARHVVSAVEMAQSGDYIVTRYAGEPDYWNAKPPLAVWGGALGYSAAENKLLGVRLVSLLLSVLLAAAVFFYARRIAGVTAGLVASLLLLTAPSIVLKHAMRSADADIYLITFVTLGMLAFSLDRRWSAALGYAALGVGFLAKSFHAAPYGVVAFVYTLYLWRQQKLSLRDVFLLPFCFLIPILPWALARYMADGTRFFEVMFFYDVVKRSTEVIEGHDRSAFLYVLKLLSPFLVPILWMAYIASAQKTRDIFRRHHMVLPLLWVGIPLLMYSLARTRIGWYAYPMFAPVAIMAGIALVQAAERLSLRQRQAMVALVAVALLGNEARIVKKILNPTQDAVQRVMPQLSARHGSRVLPVYLEPDNEIWRDYYEDTGQWRQHHYATALLLGNIRLRHGGREAFRKETSEAFLISEGGRITERQPGVPQKLQMAGRGE